ncbi:MAG TPA: hypothetical protein PLL69_03725 [Gemmatimonadales bacterium]|nr:hypothetical protein [Gemmatimonadales bacterium]
MSRFTFPLLMFAVAACAIPDQSGPAAAEPTTIRVVATDYAFEAPDTVQAGLVTWQLENRGDDGHHLIVYRIDGGHTFDEALAELAIDGAWPAWMRSVSGPEGVDDDPAGGGTVTTPLTAGNYLLVCALQHPEGNTHAAHGMARPLVVVGEATDVPEPVATDTIRMVDFAYGIPDTITAGEVRFLLVNTGQQRHHAIIEQVPGNATMQSVLADWELDSIPPGYRQVGGFTSMSPGERAWYQVTLVPGRYFMACLIRDPATGKEHAALGMMRLVEVVKREK